MGHNDHVDVDRLIELVDLHISNTEDDKTKRPWYISESKLNGRGLFATRDFQPGDIIFREKPLLIGFTARENAKLNICSVCYKSLDEKDCVCKNGCSLPICNICSTKEQHLRECELYRSFEPIIKDSMNRYSLRSLTVLRGLFLTKSQKDLIYAMQANIDPGYRKELHNAATCFKKFPKDGETIEYLHRIVAVLNTNAFEALNITEEQELGLRALYPLSGIFNHECTPNTYHIFEDDNIIVFKATKYIPKDTEFTTTYTKILWSNLSRRLFLNFTKQFSCTCVRCHDPKEFGSYLSALCCRSNNCYGFVIPKDCFSPKSSWECLKCSLEYSSGQIAKLQDFILAALNAKTSSKSIKDIIQFINEKIPKICPPSNQFVIELKLHVIWRMNKNHGKNIITNNIDNNNCINNNEEYTKEDIQYKVQYCNDILKILEKLEAGECTMNILLFEEIEKCRLLLEKMK